MGCRSRNCHLYIQPSKSTTSKPPSDGGGAAVIVGHPNVTALSSHPHRHRKGQVQAQGQKRGGAGGGGRPPNWHELTSTEQSIAYKHYFSTKHSRYDIQNQYDAALPGSGKP
jgi:hypothetical protein